MLVLGDNVKNAIALAFSLSESNLFLRMLKCLDYKPNDAFYKEGAEDRFFGSDARHIEVVRWDLLELLRDNNDDVGKEKDICNPSKNHRKRKHLSRADEGEIFLRYNYAKYRAWQILNSASNTYGKTLITEMKEAFFWCKRAGEIEEQILSANMPMAVGAAKKYGLCYFGLSESVSESTAVMLCRIRKFDLRRGAKFSTYFCNRIRGRFWDLLRKKTMDEKRSSCRNVRIVARALKYKDPMARRLALKQQAAGLHDILRKLLPAERKLIINHFGLETGEEITLADMSKAEGVTPGAISQRKQKILAKIRLLMEKTSFEQRLLVI